MARTVEDLKATRAELVERRRQDVYLIGNAHHHERIEKVAHVHIAIAAIDAVIAEGKDEPEVSPSIMIL